MRNRNLSSSRTARKWLYAATAVVGIGCLPAISRGVDRNWYVPGSGATLWSNPFKWQPFGVPLLGDNATNNSGGCTFDYAYNVGEGVDVLQLSGGGYVQQTVSNSKMLAYQEQFSSSTGSGWDQAAGINSCNSLLLGTIAGQHGNY